MSLHFVSTICKSPSVEGGPNQPNVAMLLELDPPQLWTDGQYLQNTPRITHRALNLGVSRDMCIVTMLTYHR